MPPLGAATTRHLHRPGGSAPTTPSPAFANALQAQVRTGQACGHRLHPTPHGPHQVCAQQVVPGTARESPQEGLWEQGVGGRGLRAGEGRHLRGSPFLLGSYFTAHGFQLTWPPPPQLHMSLPSPQLQSGGPRLRAPALGKLTQPTVFKACKAQPLGSGLPAPDPAHLLRQSAEQPAGAEAGPGPVRSGTDSLLPDSGSKGQTQRAEGRQ